MRARQVLRALRHTGPCVGYGCVLTSVSSPVSQVRVPRLLHLELQGRAVVGERGEVQDLEGVAGREVQRDTGRGGGRSHHHLVKGRGAR